jgi:hypothetical protein
MNQRLPDHILNQVLFRFELGESVKCIHDALGVGKNRLYTIVKSFDLWGTPYPPLVVKLGRPRLLTLVHTDVRNTYRYYCY